MSDSTPQSDLQFDHAEFKGEPVALACASCAKPIQVEYYQVGESISCDRCRRQMEFERTNGSAVVRFVKAGLFGLVAAGVGAGLYYAVRALTGYEFGLIAVVVGLLVGGGVRMGSGHRGGVPYQALAMFLTYGSIVGTYVPDIWKAMMSQSGEQAGTATAAASTVGTAAPVNVAVPAAGAAGAAASDQPAAKPEALNLPMLVFALAAFAAIVFAAPFLMGFENVIGIFIIGIGLYEAWKMNRKPDLTVTGPFRIEDMPAAAVPVAGNA
jgi:hypothetical protein